MQSYWVTILIILITIVVLIGLRAVLTGRLKRLKFGPDGLELEGHEQSVKMVAEPVRAHPGPSSAESGDPVEEWKTSRWKDHVDADHDVYFGRSEQNVEELVELVSRGPSGAITSIRGVGGIGKTASAYEAVRSAIDEYSMVAWASFRQHQNPFSLERGQSVGRSSRDVLRDLARQLGLTINISDPTIVDEFRTAIRRTARSERVLLVVDNLERIVDVEDIIGIFTGNDLVKHCHLVMTTRSAAQQLNPKVVTERLIGNLSLGPSCELIRHEGRSSRDVGSAADEMLVPIHAAVDGNPYLMKLVARRMCYQTRPLDRLLNDIKRLDDASLAPMSAEIQAYMFTTSLRQLAELAGAENARSLIHAFCSEPPGSRLTHAALKQVSELGEQDFQNVLDAAHALSLVTKHGLNDSFSIHSLLHGYTTGSSVGST